MQRRKFLTATATASTTAIAGCNVLSNGGKPTVENVELDLNTDARTGVLTLTLSGNAEAVANSEDIASTVLVDGDVQSVEAVDSETLEITIDGFVSIQSYGDSQLYSHSPIAFDPEEWPSLSFKGTNIRVSYPELAASDFGTGGYQPHYLFTDTAFAEYVTIPELLEYGHNQRYTVDRTEEYKPYETGARSDWHTKFQNPNFELQKFVHQYAGQAPASWSTDNNRFSYLDQEHAAPWEYRTGIEKTRQIPGTRHFANQDRVKLELEALTRDYLYRRLKALLEKETTDRTEVLNEVSGFLKNTTKALKSVYRGSPKMAYQIPQVASSANKALMTGLAHYNDVFSWTTKLIGGPDVSFHTFDHLTVLSDIEVNELSQQLEYLQQNDDLESFYGQYRDNLLQQYAVAKTIEEGIKEMQRLNTDNSPTHIPEEQTEFVEYVLETVQQTVASLTRSFALLDSLPAENSASDQLQFSLADIDGKTAYTGEEYTVDVYAENQNLTQLNEDVTLYADGTELVTKSVSVQGGDREVVELGFVPESEGEFQLQVESTRLGTIEVVKAFEVEEPTVTPTTGEVLDDVTVEVTANSLIEREKDFVFRVSPGDGRDPIESEPVAVPPGGSATGQATIAYREAGTYTVSVNGTATVDVTIEPCTFPADQSYPMTGYDAGNRGYNPDAEGPGVANGADAPEVIWSFNFANGEAPWGLQVAEDTLFTATNNAVVAVDPCIGERKWRTDYEDEDGAEGAPAYMDGRIYFTSRNGSVYSLDVETGEIVAQNGGNAHATATAAVDGEVYVYNEHQNLTFDEEQITSYTADLEKRWAVDVIEGYMSGRPALSEDHVAVAAGKSIGVYDRADGSEVWTARRTYSNESVSIHDNAVFSVGWSGYSAPTVAAHALEDGERIAENDFSQSLETPPQIAENSVFAGGEGGVHEFDLSTLDLTRTYKTTESVSIPFSITADRLYTNNGDNGVSCFNRETGVREWRYDIADGETWTAVATNGMLLVSSDEQGIIALK